MTIDPNNLNATAKLTFSDEFNSLSLWNGYGGTWRTSPGYLGSNGSSLPSNGELEWYINSNYGPTSGVRPWTVNNGVLTITAQQTDPSIRGYLGYNEPGLPAMGSYNYTSGFMTTASSFQQTYGYFEISAKIPAGQGLWPAFWLMPTDGSTLPELDVMEVLGQTPTTLVMSVHTQAAGYPQLFSQWATGLPDLSQSFHRFGVDWEPDKITYYLDGKPLYQLATPADLNKPMYMIANLAVGGNWPGSPDWSTHFPAQFQIDYIRAYSDLGGAAPAPTPAAPTPAPAVDTAVSGSGTIVAAAGYGQTLSGGSGADVFVFRSQPWTPATITNFQLGVDRLDVSALEGGYSGSNPVGDGYVRLLDDGAGGTKVLVTSNPGAWPSYVVDVKGVSLSAASAGGLFGVAQSPAPAPSSGAGGAVVVAGGYGQSLSATGGADTFVFKSLPWTPASISNFQVGVDRLDFSALYPNYAGSNPIADGYVQLLDDGAGGAKVLVTPAPGGVWPTYVVDLKGVSVAAASGLFGGAGSSGAPAAAAGTIMAPEGYGPSLAGTAGADTFVFKSLPWTPGSIGNFQPGVDHLDLSALWPGYTGSNPIADGHVQLADDGAGGTEVLVSPNPGSGWPTYVVDLKGVSVATANSAGLFTSGAGAGGSTAPGAQLVANAAGGTLAGTSGADHFVFPAEPWTPVHVTGFTPGVDVIDLKALFAAAGYWGSDPFADHYLTLQDDGAGGTRVLFDPDGLGGGHLWPDYIANLDHTAVSSLHSSDLLWR
ncbi:family 16 glycosylhydrolase [Phenylobacterium soli]|uniref:family 16 glycosylhydrolase n=1 Tax=Phenylobacterium soli TaxID=2170551 RepID=UPI00140418FA|nr:family 16 glycosylhydrolase [Phenylobacterium soli]